MWGSFDSKGKSLSDLTSDNIDLSAEGITAGGIVDSFVSFGVIRA